MIPTMIGEKGGKQTFWFEYFIWFFSFLACSCFTHLMWLLFLFLFLCWELLGLAFFLIFFSPFFFGKIFNKLEIELTSISKERAPVDPFPPNRQSPHSCAKMDTSRSKYSTIQKLNLLIQFIKIFFNFW